MCFLIFAALLGPDRSAMTLPTMLVHRFSSLSSCHDCLRSSTPCTAFNILAPAFPLVLAVFLWRNSRLADFIANTYSVVSISVLFLSSLILLSLLLLLPYSSSIAKTTVS